MSNNDVALYNEREQNNKIKMNKLLKKGFTLVELLIVVAILAVLSTATVIILNPLQILQEARDGQRLNDINTINSAISLYLATATTPVFTTAFNCTVGTTPYTPDTGPCLTNIVRATSGTASWVNFDFSLASGGSPLSVLPLDPTQNTTNFYVFRIDGSSQRYELNVNMESAKYSVGGTSDVESNTKDGGDNDNVYEIGTDPGLDLI